MKFDFQVLVVGAGSGGLTVALGLAAAGKSVALIEGGPIGGDCTNFGCIPSKALIDIAQSGKIDSFQEALIEVRSRRQKIQDEETPEKISAHGLTLLEGYGSFIDDHTLQVTGKDTQIVSGSNIILATGSHAKKIHIEGVDTKDILTNQEIFEHTENIKNLIVIGGGYIACELAESIASFGVQTSIIQRNSSLVPREEKESSKLLQEIFQKKGIQIYTDSNVIKAGDKKLTIIDGQNKEKQISYDKILIALGRVPNIEKLKLENAGITYSKSGIIVDSYNRTNKKHIFAIGDCVAGNPQFTHWANHEGRGVLRNIIVPFYKASYRNKTLPTVLYTHLEIARVGKTQEELLENYSIHDIVTKLMYFDANDRSKVTEDTTGFIKIHFQRTSGKILGATIFGKKAGEMISLLTSAMNHNITAYKLANIMYPYPTKSDLIKRVCDQFVVGTLGNLKAEIRYFFISRILQIFTGIIWGSLIFLFLYYKNITEQNLEEIALTFYNFLLGNPIGVLIFIVAYTIRPVILFPATFMTFMAGALFGPILGTIATVIGATGSAFTAYVIGSVFGKKVIQGDSGFLTSLKSGTNTNPFISVLMTRLLFFPYDLTNYVCGFLKVKPLSFITATFIGIIPGSLVFVLAGAAFYGEKLTSFSQALKTIDISMLYYAAGLFLVTLGIAKVIKKKMN